MCHLDHFLCTCVTEHDREQERKRGDGVDAGVHLAVGVHGVGVDQHLESPEKETSLFLSF